MSNSLKLQSLTELKCQNYQVLMIVYGVQETMKATTWITDIFKAFITCDCDYAGDSDSDSDSDGDQYRPPWSI